MNLDRTDASGVPITDWAVLPFEATRLHPLWIGAAIALATTAISTLVRVAVGDGPYVPIEDGRFVANPSLAIDLLNGVLLA